MAGDKFGKSFETVLVWKEKMEKAGFINVKETVMKVCPSYFCSCSF